MTTHVNLADATQEWFETYLKQFNGLTSSFLNDPRNVPKFFLSDRLGISVDELRIHKSHIIIECDGINRQALVALVNTLIIHDGERLELKSIDSVGEEVNEWGNTSVRHKVELDFRPR